jgi:hypothetical protein
MRVHAFEEDGEDADCTTFRPAAIRQAWQAEIDADKGLARPTVCFA